MLVSDRRAPLALAFGLVAMVVALGSLATGGTLETRMADLQLVPLTGQAKPFALPALDGTRLGLSDLAGRPALFYFWASW